jgi:hypothetical protein
VILDPTFANGVNRDAEANVKSTTPARDAKKRISAFRENPALECLESITFMNLDRFDPNSS